MKAYWLIVASSFNALKQQPHLSTHNKHQYNTTHNSIKMAASKFYPRGTVKRITKAHTNRNLSKNVDILVSSRINFQGASLTRAYFRSILTTCFSCKSKCIPQPIVKVLPCVDTFSSLVREATIHARQRGERGLSARAVRRVREVSFLHTWQCSV